MRMLHPDLLDRRALALIELIDPIGRSVLGQALMSGAGLRTVAKGGGRSAVVAAQGFAAHEAAFAAPPNNPAVGQVDYRIDILPADRGLAPRSVTLKLPRDPDPANRANEASLFSPIRVALLPSPQCPIPATAAAVRITVRKKGDGRRVAGALVRVVTSGNKFQAMALTDAIGEALVIVPEFPLTHTGPGGQIDSALGAKATVVAAPNAITLVADADISAARAAAQSATSGFADPDAIDKALPAPAGGVALQLSTRTIAILELEWKNP